MRASICFLASLFSLAACATPAGDPMVTDPDGGTGDGKEDNAASRSAPIAPVSLYNPSNLPRPIAYVDRMEASLLAPALDSIDHTADRVAVLEQLDTAEQAYLMMAIAGMEYYPVAQYGEEDLDATLRNVVERGDPMGQGAPTGLELAASVKKAALGFRADVVRVAGRPHYVVALRGTQVKQPSFVQTFGNALADLSAAAIDVNQNVIDSGPETLQDLVALRRRLANSLDNTDFSDRNPVAHAGIYLSATIVYRDLLDALVTELDLEFDDAPGPRPCVWITGHSLGGGMAPVVAYHLSRNSAFNTRARICGVYTYGAPRVGNDAFAREYNNPRRAATYEGSPLDLGSVTFRYHMDDDVIPHLAPNIPRNDTGEVTAMIAEVLMAIVRAYGQHFARIDALAQSANGRLDSLSEEDAAVAQVLYGAGDLLRNVYRLMQAAGAIDAVEGAAYRAAKQQVMTLVRRFRGLQHVGHTRWIDRSDRGEYRMATGSPTQQHHLAWMLSFVENLKRGVCADRGDMRAVNVRQHISNGLGFHRVPFYAAVLLMHTDHREGDRRFGYPDSDVDDRLPDGINFYNIPNFERRLAAMYDAPSDSYLRCTAN